MKISFWSLLLALPLVACNSAAPAQNDTNGAASSSAAETQMESSVSSEQSSLDETPLTLEQALDRKFSSQKLGIALRYPSTAIVGDCTDPIPVTARENEYAVEFVLEHTPDATCASLPSDVFNVVYAQRASNMADVRQFIDRVFSPNCEITEESEYEENGATFVRVFLRSKNPPKDEPDVACSESVLWNRTAGVAFFSPLSSKNGGGMDWLSRRAIEMPDGSIEYAFDYPIMRSIRFLNPDEE